MRSTIKASLQIQGFEVIHDTSNVASAIKIARQSKPDAAIIDLDLGTGPNGIDLAIGLRNALPSIGIVLLTGFVDPRLYGSEISQLPAGSRYLIKQNVHDVELIGEEIEIAIEGAREGGRRKDVSIPSLTLPAAQMETLRLVAKGLANEEIARVRGISEKSVEQSISRLISHFKIEDTKHNKRVELAKIYFKSTGSNNGEIKRISI